MDPQFGEEETAAVVGAVRINPTPGAGQIHGDAFIQDHDVLGAPPGMWHSGDNRGFDPNAAPDKSRVSMVVDFENGVTVVRQNPTHATNGDVGIHPPHVGVEQDVDGRVRMRLEATNGLIPEFVGTTLGESVRGDFIIDPHGGPHGVPSVDGKVTQYPSWEGYSSKPGQPPTTVLQREQNDKGEKTGPGLNLPRDSVGVGQNPKKLDEWHQKYHPDQVDTAKANGANPVQQIHDPEFYPYPMPDLPAPTPDGHGGIVVPQATQVR